MFLEWGLSWGSLGTPLAPLGEPSGLLGVYLDLLAPSPEAREQRVTFQKSSLDYWLVFSPFFTVLTESVVTVAG